MDKFRLWLTVGAAFLAQGISVSADASLVSRGSGMIYDDVLDITWVSNADINGQMDWTTANTWANDLVFAGHADWRLPNMDVNDDGEVVDCRFMSVTETDCRDNEYGHLFRYDGISLENPGGFSNLGSLHYWSGTENQAFSSLAWLFNFADGFQGTTSKITSNRHALAVHDGDIAAVPVPAALWLFLTGGAALLGVGNFRRG